jgi:hypothetical protein
MTKTTKNFFTIKEFKNIVDNLAIYWSSTQMRFSYFAQNSKFVYFSIYVSRSYIYVYFTWEFTEFANDKFSFISYRDENKTTHKWSKIVCDFINETLKEI